MIAIIYLIIIKNVVRNNVEIPQQKVSSLKIVIFIIRNANKS